MPRRTHRRRRRPRADDSRPERLRRRRLSGVAGARIERVLVRRCVDELRSPSTIACVPSPWWTSQSTIATRRAAPSARSPARATATLKRQNPLPRSRRAWWPGGRTAANATSASPATAARAAAALHRRRAAPRASTRHDERVGIEPSAAAILGLVEQGEVAGSWTRSSSASVAGLDRLLDQAIGRRVADALPRRHLAVPGRSGWPGTGGRRCPHR